MPIKTAWDIVAHVVPSVPACTLVQFSSETIERGGPCWLLILRWMGSQIVQMKGALPWLVRWACLPHGCSVVLPIQNICFLTVHYLNSFVLIAQQAGQAAVLGRLSLSKCLWVFRTSDINVYLGLSPVWLITVRRRYHFEDRQWGPKILSPSLLEGRCHALSVQCYGHWTTWTNSEPGLLSHWPTGVRSCDCLYSTLYNFFKLA